MVQVCRVLNTLGLVMGWCYATMNRPANTFLDLLSLVESEDIVLPDLGFRAKQDTPDTLKRCQTQHGTSEWPSKLPSPDRPWSVTPGKCFSAAFPHLMPVLLTPLPGSTYACTGLACLTLRLTPSISASPNFLCDLHHWLLAAREAQP